MEVVLGAEMLSQLLPDYLCFCLLLCLPQRRMGQHCKWWWWWWGDLLFLVFKNKHKYNCVSVCMICIMAKLFPLRNILKITK